MAKKKQLIRDHYTLFRSFIEQIDLLPSYELKGIAYEAISFYAVYGTEVDMAALPFEVRLILPTMLAVLKNGRAKALAGSKGGTTKRTNSKTEAKTEQNPTNRIEEKGEIEKRKENEIENINRNTNTNIEAPLEATGDAVSVRSWQELFEIFWDDYPIQVDKEGALKAWKRIPRSRQTYQKIMDSLDAWRETPRWNIENRRYIPYPAAFLNKGYWNECPGVLPAEVCTPEDQEEKEEPMGKVYPSPLDNIRQILAWTPPEGEYDDC